MSPAIQVSVAGIDFQNPILLAAGTAGYGRELASVIQLDSLGGLITKAVSIAPRKGAPAPRLAEFEGGMINAVGLANPGADEVASEHLPWLARSLSKARVIVNVAGSAPAEFAQVIERLDDSTAISAYELNVSCPNVKAGGLEFAADHASLSEAVTLARSATKRPLFVKLSPTLPDIGSTASVAMNAGADGISVVNTIPGMVIDIETRAPSLGFGSGGVSGPGLLPVGILATHRVWRAAKCPIIGVGGITCASDVVQYVLAGAAVIAVGTAAMQSPRLPERLVKELREWCRYEGVRSINDLRGELRWEH